jgi:hypothetical protein
MHFGDVPEPVHYRKNFTVNFDICKTRKCLSFKGVGAGRIWWIHFYIRVKVR